MKLKRIFLSFILFALALSSCTGTADNSAPDDTTAADQEPPVTPAPAEETSPPPPPEPIIYTKDTYPKPVFGSDVGYNLKLSDFVSNPVLWGTPMLRESGAYFEVRFDKNGSWDFEVTEKSIEYHKLGEHVSYRPAAHAAEWGYSITHLDGLIDGAGMEIKTGFAGEDAPKTRQEAVEKIWDYLQRQYIKGADHPWESINGHYPWHHYAGEAGFDVLGSEIGENINNYQWHIALTRGAARQYQTPWTMDFSNWHGPSVGDWNDVPTWGIYSNPDGGHSMSLMERSYLMSYMAGADCTVAEGGSLMCFTKNIVDVHYELSPYGEVCRKINAFITANPDIGLGYTPFGIVLDYYHGSYPGFERKAFHHFPYDAGDNMTWRLINMIWPGGWEVMEKKEVGTMVNGPYGDLFDVMLQNASQEVLNSYPVLILTGSLVPSNEEITRYVEYVNQGGTLILNTVYLQYFPSDFGDNENVIVYGEEDYNISELGEILLAQIERFVPFTFSTDIQYLINVKNGSLLVTLINNDGVRKHHDMTPAVIDESKFRDVIVTYTGNLALKSVADIYNGQDVSLDRTAASITIPAGGMAVLEFKFD